MCSCYGTVMTTTLALPSIVTVMLLEPDATPLTVTTTRPLPSVSADAGDAVALAGSLDTIVAARPLSTVPPLVLAVKVMELLPPMGTVRLLGNAVTVSTGTSETESDAVLLFPSLVAVITAAPESAATTAPTAEFDMLALAVFDVQTIGRPMSTLPDASVRVAVKVKLSPTISDLVEGTTDTLATGTSVDTNAMGPGVGPTPSTVTRIVAVSAPSAVISPPDVPLDTDALAGLLLVQTTVRPARASVPPTESFATTLACTVCPTKMLESGALMLTDTTGTGEITKVRGADDLPSETAVTAEVPGDTALTSPLAVMVTAPGGLTEKLTVRPESGAPNRSSRASTVCWVCVTNNPVRAEVSETLFTASCTKMLFAPVFPSAAAITVVVPAATPVATPLWSTVAISGAPVDQATVRPSRMLLLTSRNTAAADTFWLTKNESTGVLTLIVLTGASTFTVAVLLRLSKGAVAVMTTGIRPPGALTPVMVEVTLWLPERVPNDIDALAGASVIRRPGIGAEPTSTAVAVTCVVPPTKNESGAAIVTMTLLTGTRILSVDVGDAVP